MHATAGNLRQRQHHCVLEHDPLEEVWIHWHAAGAQLVLQTPNRPLRLRPLGDARRKRS
jgi:hypothetical protein